MCNILRNYSGCTLANAGYNNVRGAEQMHTGYESERCIHAHESVHLPQMLHLQLSRIPEFVMRIAII